MRIITRKRLDAAAKKHPKIATTIHHWYHVTSKANWTNLVDTRKTFAHADLAQVASGKKVTIFNLTNAYRLITAIHYNRQTVFILHILTHAEYDRNHWKHNL